MTGKGKWSADFTLTLDGIDHVLSELKPKARQRIFKLVGRGVLAGTLTARDFISRILNRRAKEHGEAQS